MALGGNGSSNSLPYRADIDGLRAIAVLSVFFFHLSPWWMPGGFVGVDVFFVISGYLISKIIQKELDQNRFSIRGFYARRVCRILPAYFCMAAATSVVAYLYFYPSDLKIYAQSLTAATLSVSNFYFWRTAGYFGVDASTQPLLHTWSLAVEEQFYIFLPVFLIVAHKSFRKYRDQVLIVALAASFLLNCFLMFRYSDADFYLIPTRAWELLAGTLLAFGGIPLPAKRWMREMLAPLGGVLILLGIFALNDRTPYPGAAALLPCCGTVLVILSGEGRKTLIGSFLSIRPMRFIGQISYSLYLWHWPLIILQKHYSFLDSGPFSHFRYPNLLRYTAVFVVALLISILSWQFIEKTFRRAYLMAGESRVLLRATLATGLLAAVGVAAITTNGFRGRFSPEVNRIAAYLDYGQEHLRPGQCFILKPYTAAQFDTKTCLETHAGRQTYLLVGDSTAADLWYGLSHTLKDADVLQATAAGCKPLLKQGSGADPECTTLVTAALTRHVDQERNSLRALIIAGRWSADDLAYLAQTLECIQKKRIRIVVLGPPVEYRTEVPRLMAMSIQQSDPGLPERALVERPPFETDLEKVVRTAGASYISLYGLLCSQNGCTYQTPAGVPLQFDGFHYTRDGSEFVARGIEATHLLD